MVRLAESGALTLGSKAGQEIVTYNLNDWKEAFKFSAEHAAWGNSTAFTFE